MSAFLGPIHYWLYNKIQLQEELIREIVSFGEESSWKVFSDKKLAEETVNKELRPLNELIDVMNIHGWLQERIQDAESRYALLVTRILKEDEKHLPALEEVAYNFGKEHALDASYGTRSRAYFLGAGRRHSRPVLDRSGRRPRGILPSSEENHGRDALHYSASSSSRRRWTLQHFQVKTVSLKRGFRNRTKRKQKETETERNRKRMNRYAQQYFHHGRGSQQYQSCACRYTRPLLTAYERGGSSRRRLSDTD